MATSHAILVVEDDPEICELLVVWLQGEGFHVRVARDGAEAVQLVEAEPDGFACILLDLTLPDMDGVDVLHALGARGSPATIVAMSANRLALQHAMRAGATAAVAKPFDLDALLSLLAKHCSGTTR
jgi:CheY-like chemotaxis protein